MPGRIQVDILKVVQRDYSLDSYRSDVVSSNFIRGNVTSFENKMVKLLLIVIILRG